MGNVKRKIVIVDDVKFHLLSLKESMKRHYDIYPAQSKDELFDVLKMVKPEMILLDINMPEIDGFEILDVLKSVDLYSDIPVMFLTSLKDRDAVVKGMRAGAVGFVFKPCTEAKLVERIENELDPEKRAKTIPVILAVDDNPSTLTAINTLLSGQYKVCTLPKPERTKELLKSLTPDLFLLDCNMPVMSGFDLIPVIRKFPEHHETPIIFLTSEGTMDNVYVALNQGASDFLVKPIDENILRSKLEQNLKDYKMLRQIRSCNAHFI